MRKPTQKEIERYVNWILEECSTPHDEIEWLTSLASGKSADEMRRAIIDVNEILNDR